MQGSPEKEKPLRVGLIGTGAISNMHARAYKNIGYRIVCCTDINERQRESPRAGRPDPPLFVERATARDADRAGIAALYEPEAVMAYPRGDVTVGRDAIRALWEQVLANAPTFEPEPPLPTLVSGDVALTCTIARDGTGVRAQVARRQADGTWLRLLDQPEIGPPVQR